MSDQCRNCEYRGVIGLCLSVECNHHESWYAEHLQSQLTEREKEIADLKQQLRRMAELKDGK